MTIDSIDLTYVLGGELGAPEPQLPIPWPRSKRDVQADPLPYPQSESFPRRPPGEWLPIPTRPDPWQ